jgi:hypothetical protein
MTNEDIPRELLRDALHEVQLDDPDEQIAFIELARTLVSGDSNLDELRSRGGPETALAVLTLFLTAAQLAATLYQVKLMNRAEVKTSEHDRIVSDLEARLARAQEALRVPERTRSSIIGALARRLGAK